MRHGDEAFLGANNSSELDDILGWIPNGFIFIRKKIGLQQINVNRHARRCWPKLRVTKRFEALAAWTSALYIIFSCSSDGLVVFDLKKKKEKKKPHGGLHTIKEYILSDWCDAR